MADSKIAEIVSSLLSGVHGISKTETVVGAPQKAGDAVVIPVHRVKIAFGAGSANAGAHGSKLGGDTGAQGAGGAVELEPVAAIAIAKDGQAHLFTVEGDEKSAWSNLLQEIPDMLAKVADALGERVRHELRARVESREALPGEPEPAKALGQGEKPAPSEDK